MLRIWWRIPFQAFVLQWILAMGSVLAGAGVLVAWRQSPGPGEGWFAVWIALLVVQAGAWHWRLRTLRLIWSGPEVQDLRERPDAPWDLLRRLARRFRPAPPSAVSPAESPPGPSGSPVA